MSERFLHVYRMTRGVRTKWRIELDATDLVIDEREVETAPDISPDRMSGESVIPDNASPNLRAHLTRLLSMGYKFKVRADGKVDLTYTPPERILLAKFFTLSIPCWFPECDELRTQYRSLLEASSPTGSASDCKDCDIAAIMGQFSAKVLPYITNHLAQSAPAPFSQ